MSHLDHVNDYGWDINAGGGGGQSNTASNIGTAGVGVFKQKSGVDLEFKKINAGSNKVTITDDTGNDEVDIDVAEANLTITESQISDLDHTDATAIHTDQSSEISGLTNKASPASGDYLLIEDSAAANGKKYVNWSQLPGTGSGEANTASSAGGTSLYKTKTGVDLVFKGLTATSSKISLSANTNDVGIDVAAASTTQAGAIEIATQAEVDTGTDTTRAVTPDTLSNYSGFPSGSGGTVQAASPGLAIEAADEGSATGNSRGTHSTDLQTERTNADEVASGTYSTITGGSDNKADGSYSTISGGTGNRTWTYSSVSGGRDNLLTSTYQSCCGGQDNTATKEYSRVSGRGGNSHSGYMDAFGGPAIDSSGDLQRAKCIQRLKTTTATTYAAFLGAGSGDDIFVPANHSHFFKLWVVAREEGGTQHANWLLNEKVVYRSGSGATTILTAITDVGPTYSSGTDAANLLIKAASYSTSYIQFAGKLSTGSAIFKWGLVYEFIELDAT